jgi:hypothetical protein
LLVAAGPLGKGAPVQCCFPGDLPTGLSEPVSQYGELKIISGLTGREPETGCFAWRLSQKQAPTKTGESYPKPETGRFGRRFGHPENRRAAGPQGPFAPNGQLRFRVALVVKTGSDQKQSHIRKQKRGVSREASVVLRNREPQRPLVPNRKWCFRVALLEQTSSGQKYYLLRESRKRAFCMRLLSFCKVEQTIAHQKVVFPSFWALPASPSNHRPASFLLILLRPVARSAGPCMPTAVSPTMPVVHVTVHPRGQTHAAQNLGRHRCYESFDRFCCHLVDNGGVN